MLRRAQRGDPDAFRQLVELYGMLTERTARALLATRAQAEDAVQEAWLDVWRGLPTYDCSRPFRPWLLTVVANRCRMSVRRKEPPRVTLDSEIAEYLPDAEDVAMRVIQSARDPELWALLSGMKPEQRQILALRFFADLELDEIAVALDIPLGTVKSRLHRALAFLRQQLEPTESNGNFRTARELNR
jgi:RNA polymerase sigma-70 factor, ECF subfamily